MADRTSITAAERPLPGFIKAPAGRQLTSCYLAKMSITDKPVEYYAVAAWELSEKFADSAYFRQYVLNLGKQVSAEVKVTIEE
ncbi:DUF4861 family protein [Chitinophaga sedimenti]|uniref:DUF4861 family protein n=1 Tax=Chitinophaga sedimenti TaxID=2033606 RepID=UPI0027E17DCE|nr:DUF4861 family protein [Chitinophaga sedimenti]